MNKTDKSNSNQSIYFPNSKLPQKCIQIKSDVNFNQYINEGTNLFVFVLSKNDKTSKHDFQSMFDYIHKFWSHFIVNPFQFCFNYIHFMYNWKLYFNFSIGLHKINYDFSNINDTLTSLSNYTKNKQIESKKQKYHPVIDKA